MIIEKRDDKLVMQADPTQADHPPPYTDVVDAQPAASHAAQPPVAFPTNYPNVAPCNKLAIHKENESIEGKYIVDPAFSIPETLLSDTITIPAEWKPTEGGERPSLSLFAPKGDVNVEVWIAPRFALPTEEDAKRASIEIRGRYVTAKLNTVDRRPFTTKIFADAGEYTQVEIPLTFRGPLTIHAKPSDKAIKFSKALAPLVTTFSDAAGVRKCFVGDHVAVDYGNGEWAGSSIEITNLKTKVYVAFVGELEYKLGLAFPGVGGSMSLGVVRKTVEKDVVVPKV